MNGVTPAPAAPEPAPETGLRAGPPDGSVGPPPRERLPARRLRPVLEGRERFLAFLRARLGDADLAEDVLQTGLLRALQAAPAVDSDERLVAWFYRVLQNAVVDTYRRRDVARRRTSSLDAARDLAAEPAAADEAALCACLGAVLPAIRADYAGLIDAMDLQGEAPEAAAARLGITRNTLKVRHHRARQALRRRLEETCRVCAKHHCLDCTCQDGTGAAPAARARM